MDPIDAVAASFPEILDYVLKFSAGRLPPEELHAIDRNLKQIQASNAGWWLADRLLSCPQVEARFFGAVTIGIKLNNNQWYVSISFRSKPAASYRNL
jgi:hypothetical protein